MSTWVAWYANNPPTKTCAVFHHDSERKAEYDARVWNVDLPDLGPYAIYQFDGEEFTRRKVIA